MQLKMHLRFVENTHAMLSRRSTFCREFCTQCLFFLNYLLYFYIFFNKACVLKKTSPVAVNLKKACNNFVLRIGW